MAHGDHRKNRVIELAPVLDAEVLGSTAAPARCSRTVGEGCPAPKASQEVVDPLELRLLQKRPQSGIELLRRLTDQARVVLEKPFSASAPDNSCLALSVSPARSAAMRAAPAIGRAAAIVGCDPGGICDCRDHLFA